MGGRGAWSHEPFCGDFVALMGIARVRAMTSDVLKHKSLYGSSALLVLNPPCNNTMQQLILNVDLPLTNFMTPNQYDHITNNITAG